MGFRPGDGNLEKCPPHAIVRPALPLSSYTTPWDTTLRGAGIKAPVIPKGTPQIIQGGAV
jgi:hypothetical protein